MLRVPKADQTSAGGNDQLCLVGSDKQKEDLTSSSGERVSLEEWQGGKPAGFSGQ